MIINEILGIQEVKDQNAKITTREAARAIVLKGSKILMVYTNKGDYKFPGGGVKKKENMQEALKREVMEETGYVVSEVGEEAGRIIQRSINQYDEAGIFEMTSYYYFCSVLEEPQSQHLEQYEREQEFTPVWIELDEVINNNEMILRKNKKDMNPWVRRETLALKRIREYGKR